MIVQSVKCLPCKIEDSSLILQNLPKKWGGGSGYGGTKQETEVPGRCVGPWDSLATQSSIFGEFQASKIL